MKGRERNCRSDVREDYVGRRAISLALRPKDGDDIVPRPPCATSGAGDAAAGPATFGPGRATDAVEPCWRSHPESASVTHNVATEEIATSAKSRRPAFPARASSDRAAKSCMSGSPSRLGCAQLERPYVVALRLKNGVSATSRLTDL